MSLLLAGRSILVVEDEPLIALELQDALAVAGSHVVTAFSLDQALALLNEQHWSAAVLDYDLTDGTCVPISDWLRDHQIPFVVYSGYGEIDGSPSYGVHIGKPAPSRELVGTLEQLLS
jgi:DNA-binding response OmpR family regulator